VKGAVNKIGESYESSVYRGIHKHEDLLTQKLRCRPQVKNPPLRIMTEIESLEEKTICVKYDTKEALLKQSLPLAKMRYTPDILH